MTTGLFLAAVSAVSVFSAFTESFALPGLGVCLGFSFRVQFFSAFSESFALPKSDADAAVCGFIQIFLFLFVARMCTTRTRTLLARTPQPAAAPARSWTYAQRLIYASNRICKAGTAASVCVRAYAQRLICASKEGGGVRSGPGEARTTLLLHIISVRPSKQPLMVRTFLKVYMELGSYFFVSARTNKRHHHHRICKAGTAASVCMRTYKQRLACAHP